ncbi:hypothetical protein PR002_g13383 [Phytophthora rubi]|uniref:Uncharacterized protein n=1 Tax=Phytophthora rubi TaxID=129364 RepID=A0A6A3LDD8_9STRA|nr:hypothetical protein PR002_g13383 [Phytophthora rubi]
MASCARPAAAATKLVAASVLAHGKLRTSCSSGDEAGGVVQAADARLRTSCTSGDEAGGVAQAAHGKLRTSCSSGDEAGGVVQAAHGKLRTSCTSFAVLLKNLACQDAPARIHALPLGLTGGSRWQH